MLFVHTNIKFGRLIFLNVTVSNYFIISITVFSCREWEYSLWHTAKGFLTPHTRCY